MKNKWLKSFKNLDDLNKILEDLDNSIKIVYTYGAWDLLHPGHIHLLSRAKMLGDFLIAGVVSDEPIKELKGNERPVQAQDERLITIGSLRCVDAAISQPKYDPSDQLKYLKRVDILTKGLLGEEGKGKIAAVRTLLSNPKVNKETIEKLGGELITFNYTKGFSTSSIVGKLQKSEEL